MFRTRGEPIGTFNSFEFGSFASVGKRIINSLDPLELGCPDFSGEAVRSMMLGCLFSLRKFILDFCVAADAQDGQANLQDQGDDLQFFGRCAAETGSDRAQDHRLGVVSGGRWVELEIAPCYWRESKLMIARMND